MSKGSMIVPVRIPEVLYITLLETIKSANRSRKNAEYTVSEWIRKAITEKLEHLSRSRKRKTVSPLDSSIDDKPDDRSAKPLSDGLQQRMF